MPSFLVGKHGWGSGFEKSEFPPREKMNYVQPGILKLAIRVTQDESV